MLLTIGFFSALDTFHHVPHEVWQQVGITLLVVFFTSITTGFLAGRLKLEDYNI